MTPVLASTILDNAAETLGRYLPRLGGAIALLLLGLVLAWFAGRVIRRSLEAAGLDDLAERHGVASALARFGVTAPLSRVVGTAIRLALVVVTVVAAVSLLGLDALSSSLNAAILFVPRLLAALVLVVAGLVLAEFLRQRVDEAARRMDVAAPLGVLVEIAVVAIFVSTALAQLSVPLAIATVIVAILLAAAAFSVALAFGLGSRETARDMAAGRSVSASLAIGSEISVGELHGEVIAVEGTATLLRSPEGDVLRVPNHVLVGSVVRIHEAADTGGRPAG